jgi:hypothetical protein
MKPFRIADPQSSLPGLLSAVRGEWKFFAGWSRGMVRNAAIRYAGSGSMPRVRDVLRNLTASGLLSCLLFTCSGCVTDPAQSSVCDDCPADGEIRCLPRTNSQHPPNAMISADHRCVEPLPKDSVPVPAGAYVQQWRETMVAGAQQQHWLISRNEWYNGGSELGPDGRNHISRISEAMKVQPNWVVIETEPVSIGSGESYEDALLKHEIQQSERRDAIVTALVEAGHSNAEEWVVFEEDRSVGIRGIEAPMIFNRQFMGGGGNRGGIGRGGMGGGGGGIGGGGGGGFGGGGGGFGGGGGGIF